MSQAVNPTTRYRTARAMILEHLLPAVLLTGLLVLAWILSRS